jgi:hypothetical protein
LRKKKEPYAGRVTCGGADLGRQFTSLETLMQEINTRRESAAPQGLARCRGGDPFAGDGEDEGDGTARFEVDVAASDGVLFGAVDVDVLVSAEAVSDDLDDFADVRVFGQLKGDGTFGDDEIVEDTDMVVFVCRDGLSN